MNLNLNGLPEGADDAEVFAPTPLLGEQGDPMAVWKSKALQPEQAVEQAEAWDEVASSEWVELEGPEIDALMQEFVKAISDLLTDVSVGSEWQSYPLGQEATLLVRKRTKDEYTEAELDSLCPHCDRPMRDHNFDN